MSLETNTLRRNAAERRERILGRREAVEAALPRLIEALVGRGAVRVFVFGSLAHGVGHEGSDLDLAVEGLPEEAFWAALAELIAISPVAVDLVRVEDASSALRTSILTGRIVHGG